MSVRILAGDCRAVLPTLPGGSVQCVVTSPPYWGLRDYGVAEQLGLEPTPEAYVAAMVGVFREVRRVLRDDGTLWLNMGDSYATNGERSNNNGTGATGLKRDGRNEASRLRSAAKTKTIGMSLPALDAGLKPKDLVGMPWRLAFALQADGWFLRSDIIWAKPNPMPESVTDRPTKSHEYVFLLTKSARYFYDADAVREPHARLWDESNGGSWAHASRTDETALTKGAGSVHRGNGYPLPNPLGRNLRSVWTINPEPFPDAHFATFPTALAARCIRAGTSERGACSACGAPWARQTERTQALASDGKTCLRCARNHGAPRLDSEHRAAIVRARQPACNETRMTGWQPSCACAAPVVPCTVLDPFGGSGTVGEVAESLGRDSILVELSSTYVAMARQRTAQMGLFSSRPTAADARL